MIRIVFHRICQVELDDPRLPEYERQLQRLLDLVNGRYR